MMIKIFKATEKKQSRKCSLGYIKKSSYSVKCLRSLTDRNETEEIRKGVLLAMLFFRSTKKRGDIMNDERHIVTKTNKSSEKF